jgi:hypothetical protein
MFFLHWFDCKFGQEGCCDACLGFASLAGWEQYCCICALSWLGMPWSAYFDVPCIFGAVLVCDCVWDQDDQALQCSI